MSYEMFCNGSYVIPIFQAVAPCGQEECSGIGDALFPDFSESRIYHFIFCVGGKRVFDPSGPKWISAYSFLIIFKLMNIEEIREYCICIPEVTEGFPFGDPALVFIVAGKMFALLDLSEESRGISLKCDPERAIELKEKYEAIQPGWHMNKVI
jgi:hypothetical protein